LVSQTLSKEIPDSSNNFRSSSEKNAIYVVMIPGDGIIFDHKIGVAFELQYLLTKMHEYKSSKVSARSVFIPSLYKIEKISRKISVGILSIDVIPSDKFFLFKKINVHYTFSKNHLPLLLTFKQCLYTIFIVQPTQNFKRGQITEKKKGDFYIKGIVFNIYKYVKWSASLSNNLIKDLSCACNICNITLKNLRKQK